MLTMLAFNNATTSVSGESPCCCLVSIENRLLKTSCRCVSSFRTICRRPFCKHQLNVVTMDWVAKGCCQPPAPTDPYVRALAHTVPQNMASL